MSGRGGRELPLGRVSENNFGAGGCGGEYAWGLGNPFWRGGLSVRSMGATVDGATGVQSERRGVWKFRYDIWRRAGDDGGCLLGVAEEDE